MNCSRCGKRAKVKDSRTTPDGSIMRRRECEHGRFTTYETRHERGDIKKLRTKLMRLQLQVSALSSLILEVASELE